MRRAVFLDRDGVINRAIVRNGLPHSPSSVDEVEVLTGVPEACERLRAGGYLLIVVTNQPDAARGLQTRERIREIHEFLRSQVPLDDIRVCYHDDRDGCDCRKPKPGLLLAAARDWDVDVGRSFMVGDRWRDIEAGRRAGCRTIFLNHKYSEPAPANFDFETGSLYAAADWILAAADIKG